MKKTTKKIISSILIILLALAMIASVILPAFAAEEAPTITSAPQNNAKPFDLDQFIQGFYAPTAMHFIVLFVLLMVFVLLTFLSVRGIRFLVYRSKAKKLIAEHIAYVQLTELPQKLILAHFADFSHSKYPIKTMERHFLEELYRFFLTQKSEELAKADIASIKDKDHLATRAGVYRKVIESSYPYEVFLDRIPLDTEQVKLL